MSWFKRAYTASFALLVVLYLCLTFIPTPDRTALHHYHLSTSRFHWLVLPIVIFLILIWIAAYYGSLRVQSYAYLIRRSADGKAFKLVADGILILAISLPVTVAVNSIITLVERYHPGARESLTIINNYFNLLIMGVALTLIARGAEGLSGLVETKIKTLPEKFWVFLLVVFSVFYAYFVANQPEDSASNSVYYMPRWLVLATIAIPYIYIWYRGIKGAYLIHQYQTRVRGALYKHALRYLALGIGAVVLSSVINRTISTAAARITRLDLTPILLIIYGFLIVIAIGYILIALGAKKLKQIEEA